MPHISFMFLINILIFILFLSYSTPAISSAPIDECRTAYFGQKEEAYSLCSKILEEDSKNAEIQKMIGDMYYWGWGDAVTKDLKEAAKFYKRSAAGGNVEAKYNLGVLYEKGFGVSADYERSFKWFLSAAEDGHADAQFNLANMYSKGAGVSQNQGQAFRWYARAANQGVPEAQYNLGNRFAIGKGVSPSPIDAYKWYIIAANSGNQAALATIERIRGELTDEQTSIAEKEANEWKPVIE